MLARFERVDERTELGGGRRPEHVGRGRVEARMHFSGARRHDVLDALAELVARAGLNDDLGTLLRGERRGQLVVDLEARTRREREHVGVLLRNVVLLGEVAVTQRGRDVVVDAHLRLEHVLERAAHVAARIQRRGARHAHDDSLDVVRSELAPLRDAQGRLRRGLREVAGRYGFEEHREDLRPVLEQLRNRRREILVERRKQARLAVDRGARHVRAASRELHGSNGAARGKTSVEEHLAAAGRGPFVVARCCVGAETERRGGLLGRETEQLRARRRRGDRPRDSGGPEILRHVDVEDHPANFAADLVARDERSEKVLATRLGRFGEREQRRHEHGSQVTHAADVHVVAHQPVADHAVRERRVLHRHDVARADDPGAAARERAGVAAGHLCSLPAPR